jgi:uncharacterized protein YjbI with pentapeptide repeats
MMDMEPMQKPNKVRINGEKLSNIIKEHALWLKTNGEQGKQADLSYQTLKFIDFSDCQLNKANFQFANIDHCVFNHAKLVSANFNWATIAATDFKYANMYGAMFNHSSLSQDNFDYADLRFTEFNQGSIASCSFKMCNGQCATFKFSKLNYCGFKGANLHQMVVINTSLFSDYFEGATLTKSTFLNASIGMCAFNNSILIGSMFDGLKIDVPKSQFDNAVLSNTKFIDVDFTNATGLSLFGTSAKISDCTNVPCPMACPSNGSFIGWKKGRVINKDGKERDCIIKLEIPETAKRSSATSRKCRADKVKVLEIQYLNGRKYPADTVAFPLFKSPATDTQYVVGKITKCSEKFETNRWKECASGIHFFITYEEALKYGT